MSLVAAHVYVVGNTVPGHPDLGPGHWVPGGHEPGCPGPTQHFKALRNFGSVKPAGGFSHLLPLGKSESKMSPTLVYVQFVGHCPVCAMHTDEGCVSNIHIEPSSLAHFLGHKPGSFVLKLPKMPCKFASL